MIPSRPVWAEVSLARLTGNYRLLRLAAYPGSEGPPPELLAVVKADAYGHSVQQCGPALAAAGAQWLGVTSADEGACLRRALGVLPGHLGTARILVMSGYWPGEAELLLERSLTPQVWEGYHFAHLHAAATRLGLGPASVPVHLEVDTGMARQGIIPGPDMAALLAHHCASNSPIFIEGAVTHFSAPEQLDGIDTDAQIARFAAALAQLAAAGIRPRWVHAGNSATVFDPAHVSALTTLAHRYGARLMIRPGLALYGYPVRFSPSGLGLVDPATQSALHPVLAFKTRITSLRRLDPGEGAGYNSTFRAARPSRLALTPVGYADGLNRLLSNKGTMLVRGRRAPIAGRISMDQTILDVTNVPDAAIGDEVVILGEQEGSAITAWEHADLCGTIPYEILCNIGARVPRLADERSD